MLITKKEPKKRMPLKQAPPPAERELRQRDTVPKVIIKKESPPPVVRKDPEPIEEAEHRKPSEPLKSAERIPEQKKVLQK